MRITPQMQSEALRSYLVNNAARGDRLMRQIAAGKQILRPADAPTRAPQLLRLQQALSETDGYLKQVAEVKSWLSETDSVLGQIGELLVRVRELVVMAGSSTQNADGLSSIAEEVKQIEEELLALANSRLGNRYLFSGGTEAEPFVRDDQGRVGVDGEFHVMERQIAPDQTLRVNVDGRRLFVGSAAGGEDPGLFDLLRQIHDHLLEGEAGQAKLRIQDLAALDAVFDRVLKERAQVGAWLQRTERVGEQLVDLQVRLQQHLAELDGFDLARSITELRQQEASYEAALMVTARLGRLSLLDWLR
ncbi:MAG: flagellar hook-associated protein FlgL [Limnochordales bacterium]|nr:flagellar hook-associated protein FlgL [Limnochordales bacterium]